jgi:hypothetical protein
MAAIEREWKVMDIPEVPEAPEVPAVPAVSGELSASKKLPKKKFVNAPIERKAKTTRRKKK